MKPETILNPAFDELVNKLSSLNAQKHSLIENYKAKQEEFKKIHEDHKAKMIEMSAAISQALEQISKIENSK